MTRETALDSLRRLSAALPPDLAGTARLLERISQTEEPELLRDLLIERGAAALLEELSRPATAGRGRAFESSKRAAGRLA